MNCFSDEASVKLFPGDVLSTSDQVRWCQATCKGVLPWEQCAFCHPFFAFHLHGCSCEGTTSLSLFWGPVRQSPPVPCKALSDPVKYVSDPGFPQTSSAVYTYPPEPRRSRPALPDLSSLPLAEPRRLLPACVPWGVFAQQPNLAPLELSPGWSFKAFMQGETNVGVCSSLRSLPEC